ncbi:MAG: TetR/AcrR family transcriptional regulator [Proteobacteria bacterium]|nr:TetR/AcrR family transcriptional regulator [Pseudomonadota bacterium]
MSLPRFKKLDQARQRAILDAAASEFAERGFQGASYNRIIEAAGISKGAMYYYFADKDDLYRTVLEAALDMWLEHMGPLAGVTSAASYWRECEAMYRRILLFFLDEPISAALCWSVSLASERGDAHPALGELNQRFMAWTAELVQLGRALGAVRDDLPVDLLVHVGFAMLEGMDRWLAAHWQEMSADGIDDTVGMMIGLIRRIAEPDVPARTSEDNHD